MPRAGRWRATLPARRAVLRWGGVAASLGFVYLAYVYLTLPDVRVLATVNPATTAFMELRQAEARAAGRKFVIRQRWTPYTQISNNLRRAVLVAEDSAFFDHDGVDLKELRASLEMNWEEGRFTRGASTITQQLAKNLYLSPSRNPMRKLKELFITRRLEAALSKRRILEIYLNVIEWGDGIFGAEAASRAYFRKSASELSADEAALLAGAIINPREHNPAHPTARLRRRQQIISRRMGIRPPAPVAVQPSPESTSAAEPPQPPDASSSEFPANKPPSAPDSPAQPMQPRSGNGGSSPVMPPTLGTNPQSRHITGRFCSAERQVRGFQVYGDVGSAELEQSWRGGINYTGHLTSLIRDIVSRVPELSFIDVGRVLVFARPGRSSADGPYASCHSLGIPTSEPGYFFWSDRQTGEITRRTEWFVTKSPEVFVGDQRMNYLISFALPRFTDQLLSRSRKRTLYPDGTPEWVAKLDTVVHELYHIDPEQNCLRRFLRPDGLPSDALHSPTYFEEVAELVRLYLASNPDPERIEFLRYDFEGLRARYGATAAAAFRTFPSYPRRYRQSAEGLPIPADLHNARVEKVVDTVPQVFTSDDLQLREFSGTASRMVASMTVAAAAA